MTKENSTMNKIFNHILKARKGHYCHALEVNYIYELECIVESLIDELHDDFNVADFIEFFNTLSVYYLGEDDIEEQAIYDFDFEEHINYIFGVL